MKAGLVRLRPILRTAFSTVLAVLPALVGVGAGLENRQPLAAAVVFGMLASTFLTLIVVPVVYTLLDDAGRLLSRSRRKEPVESAA
jgi:HAE1 family hydrophobic/amphiphilic exporter-1